MKEENKQTISFWHKDGISDPANALSAKVYINGELANTKGNYENLLIVIDKAKYYDTRQESGDKV